MERAYRMVPVAFPRKPLWMPLHLFKAEACRKAFFEQFGRYPPEDAELKPLMADPWDTYWAWLPGFPFREPPLPRWMTQYLKSR